VLVTAFLPSVDMSYRIASAAGKRTVESCPAIQGLVRDLAQEELEDAKLWLQLLNTAKIVGYDDGPLSSIDALIN